MEPQPFSLPWISANTSRNSEPENVTRPIQSTPVASGSRDSPTWVSVTNTAITPIGTLTKKIHSQPMPEVITPPTTGPTATAAPITPPNTPKATPRSLALERLCDQRQRGREHHRAAGALHGAGEVQRQRVPRQAACGRGQREHDQPGHEHAPAPEQVSQRAGRQQERGERERVGVDHPLQVGERGMQRALDVGQRDVDDRDVEQQHEDRHRDGDQGPPLALHRYLPALAYAHTHYMNGPSRSRTERPRAVPRCRAGRARVSPRERIRRPAGGAQRNGTISAHSFAAGPGR